VPVEHAGHEPILVDTQPGSSGNQVLPAKNPGGVPEHDRSSGRPIQKFIPICRDHERIILKELKV
jgi:hypothetical protein